MYLRLYRVFSLIVGVHYAEKFLLQGKTVIGVAAGQLHTTFLLSDGQVLGCGSNVYGQLGHPAPQAQVKLQTGL